MPTTKETGDTVKGEIAAARSNEALSARLRATIDRLDNGNNVEILGELAVTLANELHRCSVPSKEQIAQFCDAQSKLIRAYDGIGDEARNNALAMQHLLYLVADRLVETSARCPLDALAAEAAGLVHDLSVCQFRRVRAHLRAIATLRSGTFGYHDEYGNFVVAAGEVEDAFCGCPMEGRSCSADLRQRLLASWGNLEQGKPRLNVNGTEVSRPNDSMAAMSESDLSDLASFVGAFRDWICSDSLALEHEQACRLLSYLHQKPSSVSMLEYSAKCLLVRLFGDAYRKVHQSSHS